MEISHYTKQKRIQKELDKFKMEIEKQSSSFLGYPCNLKYDYSELLDFFTYSLNNVGDPFHDSNYHINSRAFERDVLDFFGNLYRIPKDRFWGYITSGGTEGNMYGLFMARELNPDGILYFSEDTHYSIPKSARLLKLRCSMVRSQKNGEIDYDALEDTLKKNILHPAIISLNIGTTMKGAIDDVEKVLAILKRNNITRYYIHCDAALFGMILPFIDSAPKIDFTKDISSIAISGHKFIGSPIPCGIVLTRKDFVKKMEKEIEYVGILDTTIPGSRSGHAPLILWYAIKTRGRAGFSKEANSCIDNAQYLKKELEKLDYPHQLNDFSNIVTFKKPGEDMTSKWQLASQGDISHVVVMNHVDRQLIDEFIIDLKKELKLIE